MTKCLEHNGAAVRIDGYACIFGSEIRIDGQIESFAPGAFSPTLRRGAIDMRATINHHRAETWASVRDGSLKLWQDDVGLGFSASLPGTAEGRGLARAVADGLIGASILFRPFQSKPTPGGYTVTAATLTDVCLTTSPAYLTAVWLVPFELMNFMPDHALLLRRRWIGGRLKAKREARDHVVQPRGPSRPEQAAKAHHEAKTRRLAKVALSRTPGRGTRRAA